MLLKQPEGVKISSEWTVYRVMEQIGLVQHPKRELNDIVKTDREARKSADLLKRGFQAEKLLEKYVADITESKAKDGKKVGLCQVKCVVILHASII